MNEEKKSYKLNVTSSFTPEYCQEYCQEEFIRTKIEGKLVLVPRKENETLAEQLKRIAYDIDEETFEDELEQWVDCNDKLCDEAYIDAFEMVDEHDMYVVAEDYNGDIQLFMIQEDVTTYPKNSVTVVKESNNTYRFELDYVPDEDNFCSRVIPLRDKLEELLKQNLKTK